MPLHLPLVPSSDAKVLSSSASLLAQLILVILRRYIEANP